MSTPAINRALIEFNKKCDRPFFSNENEKTPNNQGRPNLVTIIEYLENVTLDEDPLFKAKLCPSRCCKIPDCTDAHTQAVLYAARYWRFYNPIAPAQSPGPNNSQEMKPTRPPLISPKHQTIKNEIKDQEADHESWEEIQKAVQNFCEEETHLTRSTF